MFSLRFPRNCAFFLTKIFSLQRNVERACQTLVIMKLFIFILIHRVLICVAKNSEEIVESEQNQNIGPDETLILAPNENALNNNYMYLYKTSDQQENYLNYRAVYGLRYRPTKKSFKNEPSNYNIVTEESQFNGSILSEVNSANETETENLNTYSASSDVESEIQSYSETSSVTESSLRLPTRNLTLENMELAVDESRNHIMRPNNRVEHALDFLAERLKKLMYYSADKTRPESKLLPHLSSLGRFLNLFSLIKFENIPCVTAHKPLRQLSGTCYNEVECFNLGGIAVDRCANGFGVCCVCEC